MLTQKSINEKIMEIDNLAISYNRVEVLQSIAESLSLLVRFKNEEMNKRNWGNIRKKTLGGD